MPLNCLTLGLLNSKIWETSKRRIKREDLPMRAQDWGNPVLYLCTEEGIEPCFH